jgi:hypothetical protein
MYSALLILILGQASAPLEDQMTPEDRRTLKIVIRAIENDSPKASFKTLTNELDKLRQLGPKAAPAVPALIKMFRRANVGEGITHYSEDVEVAAAALAVAELDGGIGKKKPKPKGDYPRALLTAKLLGAIGPAAVDAYPVLLECFEAKTTLVSYQDELTGISRSLRAQVAIPLARIAPTSKELALKFSEKLVKHVGADHELEEVLKGLVIMGQAATPALPGLILCIERKRAQKCRIDDTLAITALAALGSEGVAPLIEQFKKSEHDGRFLKAFGDIGPSAAAAAPVLVESLLDTNRFVREEAARSLGKIGVKNEEVLAGLQDALHDSESDVRTAAAEALKTLQSPNRPAPRTQRRR